MGPHCASKAAAGAGSWLDFCRALTADSNPLSHCTPEGSDVIEQRDDQLARHSALQQPHLLHHVQAVGNDLQGRAAMCRNWDVL